MQKYHLGWDGNQNNGVIFNETYPWGALYEGIEHKPKLSFNFDVMVFTEEFKHPNYVQIGNTRRLMTPAEAQEVKALAIDWVQPLGQEGNPTLKQAKDRKVNELKGEQLRLEQQVGEVESSLGFVVHARRNDKDNAQSLINSMTRKKHTTVEFKSKEGNHSLTKKQLQTIIDEIEDYGLSLYQERWAKEAIVDSILEENYKTVQEAVADVEAIGVPIEEEEIL